MMGSVFDKAKLTTAGGSDAFDALEGAELESVGGVRNRFQAFVAAQTESESEEGATAEDEAGDPVEVEEVEA